VGEGVEAEVEEDVGERVAEADNVAELVGVSVTVALADTVLLALGVEGAVPVPLLLCVPVSVAE
jgi:hypothetical protein